VGLASALGAARDAAIDPILEFLHLTPIGMIFTTPWASSSRRGKKCWEKQKSEILVLLCLCDTAG